MRLPNAMLEQSLRFRRMRDYFYGAPRESIRYLNHPVRFDTRNASQLLARHGMTLPALRGVRRRGRSLLP